MLKTWPVTGADVWLQGAYRQAWGWCVQVCFRNKRELDDLVTLLLAVRDDPHEMPHFHLQDRSLDKPPHRWARTEVTFFGPAYKREDTDRQLSQKCSRFIARLPKDEAEDLVLAARRLALELELWKVNNRRYPRGLAELRGLRHELDNVKRLCSELAHPIREIDFPSANRARASEVLVLESTREDSRGRVVFYRGANVGISRGILIWPTGRKRPPRRPWLRVLG